MTLFERMLASALEAAAEELLEAVPPQFRPGAPPAHRPGARVCQCGRAASDHDAAPPHSAFMFDDPTGLPPCWGFVERIDG